MKIPPDYKDFDESVLDLKIIAGENSEYSHLSYNWKVTDFD